MKSPFRFLSRRATREALRYAGARRRSFTLETLEQRQMMTVSGDWAFAATEYLPSSATATFAAAAAAAANPYVNWSDAIASPAGQADLGASPYLTPTPAPGFDVDSIFTPAADPINFSGFDFNGIRPGMPFLDSNPGAEHTLYLNFTGSRMQADFKLAEYGGHNLREHRTVFDLDGDAHSFNSQEQDAIFRIWKYVADDYAPFNVNVTTYNGSAKPSYYTDNVLEVAIGGAFNAGEDYTLYGIAEGTGGYRTPKERTVFVFSENIALERLDGLLPARMGDGSIENFAKAVADTASHEAGHEYGLEHQSEFIDLIGVTIPVEYRLPSPLHGGNSSLMGRPFGPFDNLRSVWSEGETLKLGWQDDLLTLEDVFLSSTTGSGFRADDVPDDRFAWLPGNSANGFHKNGLIGVNNWNPDQLDEDWYAFHNNGGPVQVSVHSPAGIYGNLNSKIEVWAAHATPEGLVADRLVLASGNEAWANGVGAANLPAGDYMVLVTSTGGYGNLGNYELDVTATGWGGIQVPAAPPWQMTGFAAGGSAAAFSALIQSEHPELTTPEIWTLWSGADAPSADAPELVPEVVAAEVNESPSTDYDSLIEVAAPLAGDFDGDRRVTGNDFLFWQQNLGAAVAAVPETAELAAIESVFEQASNELTVWQNGFGAQLPEEIFLPERSPLTEADAPSIAAFNPIDLNVWFHVDVEDNSSQSESWTPAESDYEAAADSDLLTILDELTDGPVSSTDASVVDDQPATTEEPLAADEELTEELDEVLVEELGEEGDFDHDLEAFDAVFALLG